MNVVLIVVSLIIASVIVQAIRGLFMKIIGANVMFLNGKTQLIIIIIVTAIIYAVMTGK